MPAILRKAKRLLDDPVLCRWLVGRLTGCQPPPERYSPHRPPYLTFPAAECGVEPLLSTLAVEPPGKAQNIAVPGENIELIPGMDVAAVFAAPRVDGETLSALHRFAWVPLSGPDVDLAWVQVLWAAWCDNHAVPDDSPAWEAYTAAERVINLLDFARHHGLPGPRERTLEILAAHGPGILDRLEYYGETGTCNHLANNGRGVWRLGLALGMPALAQVGLDILLAEAERLFLPSGMLREDSTHYHLLYVRNYADAWLAARRHSHVAAPRLEAVARRLFAVLPQLLLPGGWPVMGDISPDSPPDYLSCLLPGGNMETGWAAWLSEDERRAVAGLHASPPAAGLCADGWMRADCGPWSGLWHCPPAGWSLPTSHGHADLTAPELHFRGIPIFIDPGRGAYGECGEAALYRSAAVHGLLQVEGVDPFPVNKPYYTDQFRRSVVPDPPECEHNGCEVTLRHRGYERLRGVGEVERSWRFAQDGMEMRDLVVGKGRKRVASRLVTPWQVERAGKDVVIFADSMRLVVSASVPLEIRPLVRWKAYGNGTPAWAIEYDRSVPLSWTATWRVILQA